MLEKMHVNGIIDLVNNKVNYLKNIMDLEDKFSLWGERSKEIQDKLTPDLGLRTWDDITRDEKGQMWNYIEVITSVYSAQITSAIREMSEMHKVNNYTPNFVKDYNEDAAQRDFYNIFMNEDHDVVMQLFSLLGREMIKKGKDDFTDNPGPYESKEKFKQRKKEKIYMDVDAVSDRVNDVFRDFGINVKMTRSGFIPRQDEKINSEIYEPVIGFLAGQDELKEVNRDLSDAFGDYQKGDYSSSITHTISALEAYLQTKRYGETGKGTLGALIGECRQKGLIPDDPFTKKVFSGLDSIFAIYRKKEGDAHPKEKYSNEENAKLILNLAMVFLQHCIQSSTN